MSGTIRETARLRLEPVGLHHVDELALIHSDPLVAAWTWPASQSPEYARQQSKGWSSAGAGKWIAYLRVDGRLVGRGGLSRMDSEGRATRQIAALVDGTGWEQDRLEVGWALLGAFRGQGFADEMGREALRMAREELGAKAVVCYTERHNQRSRRVAERLEMEFVGQIRAEGLVEGSDVIVPSAPFAVYLRRL